MKAGDRDREAMSRREFLGAAALGAGTLLLRGPLAWAGELAGGAKRPNIILCMTDDQGWGEIGYNRPWGGLKTPELDKMAASGIRFTRFYAASPVCSPTRCSVLTGRHPSRYRCWRYGMGLRPREVTLAEAAKRAGYVTGHFGKWHVGGGFGNNKPLPADGRDSPGNHGFDEWVSSSNYCDLNPTFYHKGKKVRFKGDTSDIIVDQALKFIKRVSEEKKPFLALVWYPSPHTPHRALPADKAPYVKKPGAAFADKLGELAAVDRSVGRLRRELREMGIAEDTIVWFCSDNGGDHSRRCNRGLRGRKGELWEGGIRVPAILEWPARFGKPKAIDTPCVTSDIYPTMLEILDVEVPNQPKPIDGVGILPILSGKTRERSKPIGFSYTPYPRHEEPWGTPAALIDGNYKLHLRPQKDREGKRTGFPPVELYDLVKDPKESKDIAKKKPEVAAKMKAALEKWLLSVRGSIAGKDYK
jgi:arylsulfatase A-like enzyme